MDNFIVSARKYRPATFVSVVGQSHITSTLKNAISRNQLAHAYLFCGPRGVGKTTCARIFAKAINCLSPKDSEACGECESCRSFNEGRSFNIHELDAASNNSVDDIRSLTDQVRIHPQIGKYSVYIIDEVHMLSSAAFNAFLKTLEEPPVHAIFILATTEKHKIIPTILSRCQIFDFNRIRVEDGVEYLKYIAEKENVSVDEQSLHLIAQKADGGMRDALSMFDKAVSFCGSSLDYREVAKTLNVLDFDTYFRATDLIIQGDYPQLLTLFDEVLRAGFSPQIFIGGLNEHFRDLLMAKDPQTLPLLEMSGTMLEKYRAQSHSAHTAFFFSAISLLTTVDGTLRTASNPRLNAELALMKLCSEGQKKNGRSELTDNRTSDENPLPGLPELNRESAPASSAPPINVDQPIKSTTKISPSVSGAVDRVTKENATEPDNISDSSSGISEPERLPESEIELSGDSLPGRRAEKVFADGQNKIPGSPIPVTEDSARAENTREPRAKRPTRASIHNLPQTISGASIQSILDRPKDLYSVEDPENADNQQDYTMDPRSEEKINAVKVEYVEKIRADRPRIAVVFEEMKVSGNAVSVTVPTEVLYEEIMRNKGELLNLLAETSGVQGMIELSVIVKEDTTVRKPIKAEDKLAFMLSENPNLNLLRQKLNLDLE